MYVSILAARPLPLGRSALKSGAGDVGWQDEADGGPTAELISAIVEFADRVNLQMFNDGISEELVEAVADAFDGDDRGVLYGLSEIGVQLDGGEPARRIVGRLLEQSTLMRRRPAASRATSGVNTRDTAKTAGGDGAYRERFVASSKLQREFGSADTYVAYCRASHAGQVGICGATRKALASRAAPSRLAGRRTDPDDFGGLSDAELEIVYAREYEDSRALQDEFKCVDSYIAYRRAQRRGLVQQAIPKAR